MEPAEIDQAGEVVEPDLPVEVVAHEARDALHLPVGQAAAIRRRRQSVDGGMPEHQSRAEEVDGLFHEQAGRWALLDQFAAQNLQQAGCRRVLESDANQYLCGLAAGDHVGTGLQARLREIDMGDFDRPADVPMPVVAFGDKGEGGAAGARGEPLVLDAPADRMIALMAADGDVAGDAAI